MEINPDRQATAATHALMRALPKELSNANVDWTLCFPQCSVVNGQASFSVPLERIIDETKLLRIVEEIETLEQDVRRTFKKRGMTPAESRSLIERLTRGIGFVEVTSLSYSVLQPAIILHTPQRHCIRIRGRKL